MYHPNQSQCSNEELMRHSKKELGCAFLKILVKCFFGYPLSESPLQKLVCIFTLPVSFYLETN